jgi:hypothetical protein
VKVILATALSLSFTLASDNALVNDGETSGARGTGLNLHPAAAKHVPFATTDARCLRYGP